jgi:hypothetical protein
MELTSDAAWESSIDPSSGKVFFFNAGTGETRWDDPHLHRQFSDDSLPTDSEHVEEGAEDEDLPTILKSKRGSAVVNFDEVEWGGESKLSVADEDRFSGDMKSHSQSQNPYFRSERLSQNPAIEAPAGITQPSVSFSIEPQISADSEDRYMENQLPLPEASKKAGFGAAAGVLAGARKLKQSILSSGSSPSSTHSSSVNWSNSPSTSDLNEMSSYRETSKAAPPPASTVPIDALARAGERSNKWLEYLKKQLLMTDHVAEAGIFDIRNCARWFAIAVSMLFTRTVLTCRNYLTSNLPSQGGDQRFFTAPLSHYGCSGYSTLFKNDLVVSNT